MKRSRVAVPVVVSVLLFALSTVASGAETKGAAPAQTKIPATVPAPPKIPSAAPAKVEMKPLAQPLVFELSQSPLICSTLVDTINGIIQVAHKEMQPVLELYNNPGVSVYVPFPGIWELYYSGGRYREHVYGCCGQNKSFSVQDQQAAGCSGGDTVKQCMEKLVKSCIRQYKKRDELKAQLLQSQDKAGKISEKTKQLSDKLNQLTTTMP
jgi:hypothetical protein